MPWILRDIKDETSLVNELYKIFIENTRLTHSKSAKVEFIITAGYLESYLKPGSRIIVKSILVCKFPRLKKLHQSVYAAKAVDDEYMAC